MILIKLYKWIISPWLGHNCRFLPTCSEYAKEAIDTHGTVKGTWLGVKRMCRCHPLGGSGIDNVPEK